MKSRFVIVEKINCTSVEHAVVESYVTSVIRSLSTED